MLNTPFTAHDEIDIEALTKHVRLALDAGVQGFLVPAMASEVGKLTTAERMSMTKCVVKACLGTGVHVIGGCTSGARSIEMTSADHVRACVEAGCHGVNVAIPYNGDDVAYEAEMHSIAAEVPDAKYLMVQDWDSNGGGVPVELIARPFRKA